jgi:hypothetical protein
VLRDPLRNTWVGIIKLLKRRFAVNGGVDANVGMPRFMRGIEGFERIVRRAPIFLGLNAVDDWTAPRSRVDG